jgi:glycosidase
MTYILTTRGIPQIFYGTEVLMANPKSSEHGEIRGDFPGGWAGDAKNAFTGANLTADEKATQDFFKKMLNWRKGSEAIHQGKLLHFGPENAGEGNGVYVYFRYTDKAKVMVVLNKNADARNIDLSHYEEILPAGAKAHNVMESTDVVFGKTLSVPAKSAQIFEIR